MDEVLIDTNVLVYAHQPAEAWKQARAIDVLDSLIESGRGRLSAQALAEFFSATTGGKSPLLKTEQALSQVTLLADAFVVLDVTRLIVLEAARGVRQHRLNYWDAQIWASARLYQITTIFTEDFENGRSLEGIRFVNPFAPGFEPRSWG